MITKNKKSKLLKKLKNYRVKYDDNLKEPEIAWGKVRLLDSKEVPLGTLGNFSLVIGKAKSRKSFFLTYITSTLISKNTSSFYFNQLKKENSKILYFDTEQSMYHVQKVLNRIFFLTKNKGLSKLRVYALRSLTPQERLELIEYAIYKTNNVGIVLIDGIKDLITSINSEEEATNIASKLLKWTEEKNIHIITVLHQNKGDRNARGHLGTELTHKAETVLSVVRDDKNKQFSVVRPEMCRNEEPDDFAFEILNGLPTEVEDYEFEKSTRKKVYDITSISIENKKEIVDRAFKSKLELKYSELQIALKTAHKEVLKKSVGDSKIRDLIISLKLDNFIFQEKERAPYKQTLTNVD